MLKTHFIAKITYIGIPVVFLSLEPKFGYHYIKDIGWIYVVGKYFPITTFFKKIAGRVFGLKRDMSRLSLMKLKTLFS